MPTPGKRLRAARKALGLSQDDIARQLKISRVTVSQWENDETLPRGYRLTALAATIKLSENDLKQFGLGGAKEVARDLSAAYLPLVEWADISRFLKGGDEMADKRIAIDGIQDISAFVVPMNDNSMTAGTPDDIKLGERLIVSKNSTPEAGDIVLGAVTTGSKFDYVIRDYRPRAGAVFDLVPRAPNYETLSSTGRQSIEIIGVVIEHHRKLKHGKPA